jgi:hypothetical protein
MNKTFRAAAEPQIFFTDYFGVSPEEMEEYGAFNVSLINDLPLFIDPFLLFTSDDKVYRGLHEQIIGYLRFLRDKASTGAIDDGLLKAWFVFSEVKQTWLGFSRRGNRGSGLGDGFARSLRDNLHTVFANFGEEQITEGSHLEKLCLIGAGVGRDHVSDFTTNLIKRHLAEYTQTFARAHVDPSQRRNVVVERARFDYATQTWAHETFDLPFFAGDFVLLTPKDLLTKDETWINRPDFLNRFEEIVSSVPDEQLRAQLNNYFLQQLSKLPTEEEKKRAAATTLRQYPVVAEYYIKEQEERGDQAQSSSEELVRESERRYIAAAHGLALVLAAETSFYRFKGDTLEEARARVGFLKSRIEDRDGYRFFWDNGKPIRRESDIQLLFDLTWFATRSDVNREVNNGRGPVDFKISRGSGDKALVEFKLASNSKLKQNLQHQVPIYERASETTKSLKVIVYFTEAEFTRIKKILKDLKLEDEKSIILIDARSDNKASGSVAHGDA